MKNLLSEALKQPIIVGLTALIAVVVGVAAFRWPIATTAAVAFFCLVGFATLRKR